MLGCGKLLTTDRSPWHGPSRPGERLRLTKLPHHNTDTEDTEAQVGALHRGPPTPPPLTQSSEHQLVNIYFHHIQTCLCFSIKR